MCQSAFCFLQFLEIALEKFVYHWERYGPHDVIPVCFHVCVLYTVNHTHMHMVTVEALHLIGIC